MQTKTKQAKKINTKKAASQTIIVIILLTLVAIIIAFNFFTNNITNFKKILGMP